MVARWRRTPFTLLYPRSYEDELQVNSTACSRDFRGSHRFPRVGSGKGDPTPTCDI